MHNVINLAGVRAQKARQKNHWRIMSEITRHKTLTVEEALEYIAFAIWHRDLPEGFDGKITCEMNSDGSIEVYAVEQDESNQNQPLN